MRTPKPDVIRAATGQAIADDLPAGAIGVDPVGPAVDGPLHQLDVGSPPARSIAA